MDIITEYQDLIIEASLNPKKYIREAPWWHKDKNPYYDYSKINAAATRVYKKYGEEALNEALNVALDSVRDVAGEDAYNQLNFAIRTGCITYYTN